MKKFLIVDDDAFCREVLKLMLAPYGICDVAVNGEEAVEMFSTAVEQGERYDLICLDIMMPKLNGNEALRTIRKIEDDRNIIGIEKAKVIIISALNDSKNILESFLSKCEGFLVKPFSKNDLISTAAELGALY